MSVKRGRTTGSKNCSADGEGRSSSRQPQGVRKGETEDRACNAPTTLGDMVRLSERVGNGQKDSKCSSVGE